MEFYPGNIPEYTERRERSISLPAQPPLMRSVDQPSKARRRSLVLTPKILNEFSKVEEESVSFQKKYDTAHYYVYGSHVRQISVETSWPIDSTMRSPHSRYKSEPCIGGMDFLKATKPSAQSLSDISPTDKIKT